MPCPPFDAVILAGGPGSVEPVCRHTGVAPKSLVKIAGQEMVRYVLCALDASSVVSHAIIVGISPADLPDLLAACPVSFVAGGTNLLASVEAGLALTATAHALLFASDIPLLTAEAIRDFVERCMHDEADIYYAVVAQAVMEKRFPRSRRHFRSLRDGAYAGGDAMLVRPAAFRASRGWFARLFAARKNWLGLLRIFGWRTLCDAGLGRLTVAGAEERLSVAFGCHCRAIPSPFAEIAMDVDTPYQLELVRAYLAGARKRESQQLASPGG